MGEVNRYRYKNADLLIRGVRDFLKGIDWLEQTDAEALHKEIMAYGYKAQPVDQLDVPFDYSRYLYATKEEEKNIGLIVHAYSCYQSENIYFICLLKRVIDPSVLNHSV